MKQRIALVTHCFESGGGVPSMTRYLNEVIQTSGEYDCDIISLSISAHDPLSVLVHSPRSWFSGVRLDRQTHAGIPFTRVGAFAGDLEFQRYTPRRVLTKLLESYDLVQFVVGAPQWVCAARETQKPILLWTATTLRADRASQINVAKPFRRAWLRAMTWICEKYERRGLQLASDCLALSDYTLDSMRRWLPCENASVAIPGINLNSFFPDANAEKRDFVCVCRLEDPRKNILLLCKAYKDLYDLNNEISNLLLVGPGPSPAVKCYIRDSGLGAKIQVVGAKKGAELRQFYQRAYCFVLSSDEEGLGIVLQEAMACGCPVISTACGGPETIVKDGYNGMLVPTGDAQSLTRAMNRLWRDTTMRNQMAENALNYARANFSMEATGKVFLDLFRAHLAPKADTGP